MLIRVTTVDVKTGNQHGHSKVINYHNNRARRWLAKHCVWAFSNGYGIATNNVADEAE